MKFQTKRLSNALGIVHLAGDLDTVSLPQFKAVIQELASQGCETIVVDCRKLGSISSGGLAALLWARSTVGVGNCKIYLTEISSPRNHVLQIAKLSKLFSIEPSTRNLLEKIGGIRKPVKKRKIASNVSLGTKPRWR